MQQLYFSFIRTAHCSTQRKWFLFLNLTVGLVISRGQVYVSGKIRTSRIPDMSRNPGQFRSCLLGMARTHKEENLSTYSAP